MLNPSLNNISTKTRAEFKGDCLKREKISFDYGKIVNIVYEIDDYRPITGHPTLENCLFSAVKLTKHIDVELYKYSEYVIGLIEKDLIQLVIKLVKNVILFGVDMSSSQNKIG